MWPCLRSLSGGPKGHIRCLEQRKQGVIEKRALNTERIQVNVKSQKPVTSQLPYTLITCMSVLTRQLRVVH